MVQKTPELVEAFGIKVWARSITESGGGYIQTLASRGSIQDGHNAYCVILDEVHAQSDRSLYDVLDSSQGARKHPLFFMITTAGFDTNTVCHQQRTYLTKILGKS